MALELFGGTGTYRGGRLFKWNGTDAWIQVAPGSNDWGTTYALVILNNKLYGITGEFVYLGGRLY